MIHVHPALHIASERAAPGPVLESLLNTHNVVEGCLNPTETQDSLFCRLGPSLRQSQRPRKQEGDRQPGILC